MNGIRVAKHAGFCPGVSRAVELMEQAIAEQSKPIYCLGELIHNRTFTESLRERGVCFITPEEIPSLPKDALLFIRAHGATGEVYRMIRESGLSYVDATCPYVQKIHRIAASATDAKFIIIGDKDHPEVQGIVSAAPGETAVYSGLAELEQTFAGCAPMDDPVVLAVQTTFHTEEWKKCQKFIKSVYTHSKISDTICSITENRQKEVRELAKDSDLTVVVGSRNSSNTVKLFRIAKEVGRDALQVETAADLAPHKALLRGAKSILITAGASAPGSIIQEVINTMADIRNEEVSFAELLEASFKTLHTGDKVTGIVSAVSASELKVDLGTKHTGILVYDEITDESGIDLTEKYHVGDSIEVVCIKFSDSDGTVQLSSKRLDVSKHWEAIKAAHESGEILTGVVKEVIRKEDTFSGVVVTKGTSRVFIPASQSGVAKGESLEPLKGQKVNFKVIDINEDRKRAVGSIKAVQRAEKKQAEEEFYKNIEIGQKYVGTVRAIMNYGAFVNIGPVDGMVHISELSWGRLRPPAEVLTIGQKLNVFIKGYDPETKRISLGYKTPESDPWTIFTNNYSIGDVVDVKIVSLMPFGAFAEIIPELDGLIHNSQIAAKAVNNPASVLNVGDKVTVKIVGVDLEAKRINLSIKALLEPEEAPVEEAPAEEAAE
ncbi:MAG: 4-hydroxy-3-methylbut-2-enyl diphosphate reductase [Clostridia bacterium]|nr:4-hydroxy-3-methylbut-2-enyl diphosphate reductase [Clostridia bacterium]